MTKIFDHLLEWLLFTLIFSLAPIGMDALLYAGRHHAHWGGGTLIDQGQMLLCGVGVVFTTFAILLAQALHVGLKKVMGTFALIVLLAMVVLYGAIQNSKKGEIDRGFIIWMSVGLYAGAAALAAISTAAAAWRQTEEEAVKASGAKS